MTTKIILTECPCCGTRHDRTTSVNCDSGPKPKDVTVCLACGAICEFDQDMTMVLVGDQAAPELGVAREVQRKVRRMRGLPA